MLSRYASKQVLRVVKQHVSSNHGLTFKALDSMYQSWIDSQKRTIGRAVPASRDEEIRCEIEWLKALDKRIRSIGN